MSDIAVLRDIRDRFLSTCDWIVSADSPITGSPLAAWKTYRQALRDLPANTPDPSNVTWPTPPESPAVQGVNSSPSYGSALKDY